MQLGDHPTSVYCRAWRCWTHSCCFYFQPPMPLTEKLAFILWSEYLSRSNEYLPSNHANRLFSVCLYTDSSETAWCASLGIHLESHTSCKENGKISQEDLRSTAAWEGQCAVTPWEWAAGAARKWISSLEGLCWCVFWLIKQIIHLHAHKQ